MSNPLMVMQQYGQSPWYDNIRRSFITSGELQALMDRDGLRGVTSNPAIFEKSIAGSTDYNEALQALEKQGDMEAKTLYEHLAIQDIQTAADVMASVYRNTHKRDGYVSLEVSPYLAHDTTGTVEEARRLWREVDRDNVMIKVPATPAGIPTIEFDAFRDHGRPRASLEANLEEAHDALETLEVMGIDLVTVRE